MTQEEIDKLDRGERIEDEYGNYFYKNGENDYRFFQLDPDYGGWDAKRYTIEQLKAL